jgi:hypothetical protein
MRVSLSRSSSTRTTPSTTCITRFQFPGCRSSYSVCCTTTLPLVGTTNRFHVYDADGPGTDDPAIRTTLNTVLERILKNSQESHKNPQHNNAQNAVLFEAINLAIHLDTESSIVQSAATLLGKFILSKETNVRYLGLDTMAHLAARSESLDSLKKHQDTIILSLRDKDISVRRRGLDLLYSMCDVTNSKAIVGELLRYLSVADYSLREEMVLKIAILTEKFAVEYEWYVDTILRLMSTAGDHVGDEVWYRVVQIVTNTEELQEASLSFLLDDLFSDDARLPVRRSEGVQSPRQPLLSRECRQGRCIRPRRIRTPHRR